MTGPEVKALLLLLELKSILRHQQMRLFTWTESGRNLKKGEWGQVTFLLVFHLKAVAPGVLAQKV